MSTPTCCCRVIFYDLDVNGMALQTQPRRHRVIITTYMNHGTSGWEICRPLLRCSTCGSSMSPVATDAVVLLLGLGQLGASPSSTTSREISWPWCWISISTSRLKQSSTNAPPRTTFRHQLDDSA